jgi:hypothetical protein
MQPGLDHLGRFQVVAIDCDSFCYNPPLVVSCSVNVHLEPGYKHNTGQSLIQAKEPSVILRFRIIGEHHGNVSVAGLHRQCVPGSRNDHPFNSAKSRYRRQNE